MENKKFKPLFDKMFWLIWIPTSFLMISVTVLSAFYPIALLIIIPTDLFTFYFLATSFFGYVELRKDSLYIKFGFILKRDIPYSKIRGVKKERKFYSESMLALKNSFEHVNIKYNKYDVVSVSVVSNDEFMRELEARCGKSS